MPDTLTQTLLTVDDVAERFAVTRHWVYKHADQLAPVRVGGLLRFEESELRRYLDAHREVAA